MLVLLVFQKQLQSVHLYFPVPILETLGHYPVRYPFQSVLPSVWTCVDSDPFYAKLCPRADYAPKA